MKIQYWQNREQKYVYPNEHWMLRDYTKEHENFIISNENLIKETINFFKPKKLSDNFIFTRLGKNSDGGYVVVENLLKDVEIGYSFGVGDTWDFEKDLRKYDVDIYMFDGTINTIETNDDNILFYKEMITENSIKDLLIRFDHFSNNILLQCDIEGFEWKLFESTPDFLMENFSQIVIEFHGLYNYLGTTNGIERINKICTETFKNFIPVHIHPNNFGVFCYFFDNCVPNTFEVTFVRKDLITYNNDNVKLYKEGLDFPNSTNVSEVVFDFWGW